MSEKPLPCPFCGGRASATHPISICGNSFCVGDSYQVRCNDCMARGPYFNSKESAIAAWNRRYSETGVKKNESQGL